VQGEAGDLKKYHGCRRRIAGLPEHDENAVVRLKNLRQSARPARL
jgi:hypothetical protein